MIGYSCVFDIKIEFLSTYKGDDVTKKVLIGFWVLITEQLHADSLSCKNIYSAV